MKFLFKLTNEIGEITGESLVKQHHRSPVNHWCGEFLQFPTLAANTSSWQRRDRERVHRLWMGPPGYQYTRGHATTTNEIDYREGRIQQTHTGKTQPWNNPCYEIMGNLQAGPHTEK